MKGKPKETKAKQCNTKNRTPSNVKSEAKRSEAKQSKATQSKARQSKAKQCKAKQGKVIFRHFGIGTRLNQAHGTRPQNSAEEPRRPDLSYRLLWDPLKTPTGLVEADPNWDINQFLRGRGMPYIPC